jgi:hypothetical protein
VLLHRCDVRSRRQAVSVAMLNALPRICLRVSMNAGHREQWLRPIQDMHVHSSCGCELSQGAVLSVSSAGFW